MPLSLKMHIPEGTHTGFAQLLAVHGEHLQELEQALSEVRPVLDRADFASNIVDRTHIDKQTASELMRVLISLYALRASQQIALSEFVDNICDALKATGKENLKPVDDDWQAFKDKLSKLLSYDQTVGIRLQSKQRKEDLIDMLEPVESHPLAVLSGKYNDEPVWDDFMKAVIQYRQKMEEQEDISE